MKLKIKELYRTLAATLPSSYPSLFKTPTEELTMLVSIIITEDRIFMEPTMFYFFVFQILQPKRFLPRLPLTIVSVMTFVWKDRAVEELDPRKDDTRYGYGHFLSVDNRANVGIEKVQFVMPMESITSAVQKRRIWRLLGRRGSL